MQSGLVSITFRQLGTSFKAEAHIQHVRGAGYRTETDANGKPIETKVVRVDFGGQNQVIRAYADIQESPSARTIADATLNDVPAGISVCWSMPAPRGARASRRCSGRGNSSGSRAGSTTTT